MNKKEKRFLKAVIDDMKKIPEARLPIGKNSWLMEWDEVREKLERLLI